jgi:hypothetical protein
MTQTVVDATENPIQKSRFGTRHSVGNSDLGIVSGIRISVLRALKNL